MKEAAVRQPLLNNGFANKHIYMASVFSVLSIPRCYKQDGWLTVNSWSNVLVVSQWPAGKNESREAEDILGIRHQATTGGDIAN